MIINYSNSMAGPYHIDKGLPCQDSRCFKEGKDGIVIAAVADGLGSMKFSEIGSKVACETAVEYCASHIEAEPDADAIKKHMNNAFVEAYRAVLVRADDDGNSRDEYDTTLCLAAYFPKQKKLFYGQSGDSGLVALLEDGRYIRVTDQQRDEDGCVYPLCFGPEMWVFGQVDGSVASFMLMTDGVFEQVCPALLHREETDVNVRLARMFLDRSEVTAETVGQLEAASQKFLENYPRKLLDDDKTVLTVINTDVKPAVREEAYYKAPDWEKLREKAKQIIYPPEEPPKPVPKPEKPAPEPPPKPETENLCLIDLRDLKEGIGRIWERCTGFFSFRSPPDSRSDRTSAVKSRSPTPAPKEAGSPKGPEPSGKTARTDIPGDIPRKPFPRT
ncbi:MAG: protein phosphatase 2C domain-containing protein [Ruminococcus sp.]|nr:protein phosphatase 2C domain-containing protein [Ruminococcus sp.]